MNLTRGKYFLEGRIALPVWKDYVGQWDSTEHSNLYLDADEVLPEHEAAHDYTLANQETIQKAILNAMLPYYRLRRAELGEEFIKGVGWYAPEIGSTEDFKDLILLGTVHIMDVSLEGVAYVGYEFACSWDEEHGVGVMTHLGRVVKVGEGETAFDFHVAKRDCESRS